MNKKTIIVGSTVALGLSGLVWLVTESEIRALQNSALNRDTGAITTKNPSTKEELQRESQQLMELANKYIKIQKLTPWAYIVPYLRRFYYRHMVVREYNPIKQD